MGSRVLYSLVNAKTGFICRGKTMKRAWAAPVILIICSLTSIYVALTEGMSVQTVAIGFVVSAIALFLAHRFFLNIDFLSFAVPSPYFFVFIAYLVYSVFKGGIYSLLCIFNRGTDVMLVKYQTSLKSDILKCMLANAITHAF